MARIEVHDHEELMVIWRMTGIYDESCQQSAWIVSVNTLYRSEDWISIQYRRLPYLRLPVFLASNPVFVLVACHTQCSFARRCQFSARIAPGTDNLALTCDYRCASLLMFLSTVASTGWCSRKRSSTCQPRCLWRRSARAVMPSRPVKRTCMPPAPDASAPVNQPSDC